MGLGIAPWPLEKAVAYIRAPCGSLDTSLWGRLGAQSQGWTCKVGPTATQSLSEPYHEAQRLHPTQGGLWLDYEKRTGRCTLLD